MLVLRAGVRRGRNGIDKRKRRRIGVVVGVGDKKRGGSKESRDCGHVIKGRRRSTVWGESLL